MRKRLLIVIVYVFNAGTAIHAQTWSEWVSQKATQKKYLIQQIAQLQIYMGYLQKGYKIAKSGLRDIGDEKDAHFALDKKFFNSLIAINPSVAGSAKAKEILNLDKKIVSLCSTIKNEVHKNASFANGDLYYVDAVCTSLLMDCNNRMVHSKETLIAGTVQMSDDERLKSLNAIYFDMQQAYMFANYFKNIVSMLALNRQKEYDEVHGVSVLEELK